MKKILTVLCVLWALAACGASQRQADIEATVNAKVRATLEAAPVATQPVVPAATASLAPTALPAQLPLPSATSATHMPSSGNAIELVELTSPVSLGGNASITIRTSPNANCSIEVTSSSTGKGAGAGNNPSLVAKTAGADGVVSWQWTLGAKAPASTRQVVIDCTPGGHAEYSFEVQ